MSSGGDSPNPAFVIRHEVPLAAFARTEALYRAVARITDYRVLTRDPHGNIMPSFGSPNAAVIEISRPKYVENFSTFEDWLVRLNTLDIDRLRTFTLRDAVPMYRAKYGLKPPAFFR